MSNRDWLRRVLEDAAMYADGADRYVRQRHRLLRAEPADHARQRGPSRSTAPPRSRSPSSATAPSASRAPRRLEANLTIRYDRQTFSDAELDDLPTDLLNG
jgi:hypothetical protein